MSCMLVVCYLAYKWGRMCALTNIEMVMTVAIVVAGTLLTRFGAFLIFPPGKKAQIFVLFLGKALPAAVMGMLVVYTF